MVEWEIQRFRHNRTKINLCSLIACSILSYITFLKVSNVDDVLAYHTDFLNNCLKDCMLTNPQLLKIVHKLMMVCVTFSNFIMVSSLAHKCCHLVFMHDYVENIDRMTFHSSVLPAIFHSLFMRSHLSFFKAKHFSRGLFSLPFHSRNTFFNRRRNYGYLNESFACNGEEL